MMINKWLNTYKINNIKVEIFKNLNYTDIINLLKHNRNSCLLCKGELRGFINIYSFNYYIWVSENGLHKDIIKKLKNYNENNCITFVYSNDLKVLLINNKKILNVNENKLKKIKSILSLAFKDAELIFE